MYSMILQGSSSQLDTCEFDTCTLERHFLLLNYHVVRLHFLTGDVTA